MGSIVDVYKHFEIVEIQTGSFGNIKSKISKLAQVLPIRVVLPLAAERFIVKIDHTWQQAQSASFAQKSQI